MSRTASEPPRGPSPPAFEDRSADWLSAGEAIERLMAAALPLETTEVSLANAAGRAAAAPVPAPVSLPVHRNAAMDGYAVHAADVEAASEEAPVSLPVREAVRAGGGRPPPLQRGRAVRIMTGSPVPPGADSVVRVEDTDAESGEAGTVRIVSARDARRHVRPAGEDIREGETAVEAGDVLDAGRLALLAALGIPSVSTVRPPRVAVLSTGDELVPPDASERIRRGEAVADSNGTYLAQAVREIGAEPVPLGIAPDDAGAIREAARRARTEADVLLTSGGASMGEADLLKRVLEAEGLEVVFWRVRMRPGTPFGFFRLPREGSSPLPVLSLPGNPASAFVTFQVLVRPFLLRLAGHRRPHRRTLVARAASRLPSAEGYTHLVRVRIEDGAPPRVRPTGPQGSGLVRSLAEAQGLAVVPAEREAVEEGEEVSVLLLERGPGGSARPDYLAGGAL